MGKLPKTKKSALPVKAKKGRPTTKLCQAVVPGKLLDAARKEWLARGLTTRQVIAWALNEYLLNTNPKVARALAKEANA